jgi:hypothetical protein
MQGRERENSCCLPLCNRSLDLRSPHEIRLVGGGRAVCVGHLYVVVRTADLVLGAVAAESRQSQHTAITLVSLHGAHLVSPSWLHFVRASTASQIKQGREWSLDLPLREVLITSNVSTLASLTTFAGLGVAEGVILD